MNPKTTIRIGDVITRPKAFGLLTHVGIGVGPNLAFHSSWEKGEHLATLDEFAAGEPVTVHHTNADQSIVLARVNRALANPQKYDPIRSNCEHTVTKIVQGIARSPQLAFFLTIAVIVLVVAAVSWSVRRA